MPLTVRPLDLETAPAAWPLVREIEDAGTLQDWLAFVKRTKGARQSDDGFMICHVDGYIRGLFHWRLATDVGGQRQLTIRHFTVVGTLPAPAVTEALLDKVDELARQLKCRGTVIELPLSTDIGIAFAKRGHKVSHVSWSRKDAIGA